MQATVVRANGDVQRYRFDFNSVLMFQGIKTAVTVSILSGLFFVTALRYNPVPLPEFLFPFGSQPTFGNGVANGAVYALATYSFIFVRDLMTKDNADKYTVLINLLIGYGLTLAVINQYKQYFIN